MTDLSQLCSLSCAARPHGPCCCCALEDRRGENDIDRLTGADLISTLALAMLVILALIERSSTYIDVALGLAALTSVGTIALAKYLADEQMF
jgi:multisubunit Na+/H+ antiporter MnhF subunit